MPRQEKGELGGNFGDNAGLTPLQMLGSALMQSDIGRSLGRMTPSDNLLVIELDENVGGSKASLYIRQSNNGFIIDYNAPGEIANHTRMNQGRPTRRIGYNSDTSYQLILREIREFVTNVKQAAELAPLQMLSSALMRSDISHSLGRMTPSDKLLVIEIDEAVGGDKASLHIKQLDDGFLIDYNAPGKIAGQTAMTQGKEIRRIGYNSDPSHQAIVRDVRKFVTDVKKLAENELRNGTRRMEPPQKPPTRDLARDVLKILK